MRQAAIDLLTYIQKTDLPSRQEWERLPAAAKAFLMEVYDSGIWDPDFFAKRQKLESADIGKMPLSDVYTYFTAIIATERTFSGFYEQKAYDGTLEKLLVRYLGLTKEENS